MEFVIIIRYTLFVRIEEVNVVNRKDVCMKLKKSIILLIFVFFVSCFSFNVVDAATIDDSVLNEKISNIKFEDGNAIVMGDLTDDYTVDDLLSSFLDEFIIEYDINDVNVVDGEKVLSSIDIVTSDMNLVIDFNDGTSSQYVIKVVGDLTKDGIVNDDDVDPLIDSILLPEEEKEENDDIDVTEDINEDKSVDVIDVTHMNYSINKGNWGIGQVELEDIVSSLDASDVIYVDDTVEVIYKVSGLKEGIFKGVSGLLSYDKSLLELDNVFVSSIYGYLNEDGKFLYVFDEETEEVLITFSFKVTDKGTGSTEVTLDDLKAAIDGVVVELDQESLSKGMTIDEYGKGGDEEETYEEETKKEETVEEVVSTPVATPTANTYHYSNYVTSYVSLSSNNYIRSLEIKNQKIDFDKEKLEYSIIVGNKVNSLDLTIILDDDNATYEVIGNENFKTGKNVVTIKVTAEDGSVRNYVINVTKKKATVESPDKENNVMKYVIIGLIVLVIAGLVYVIFKDDEDEEENKGSKK